VSVDTGVVAGVSVAHGHASVEAIETACTRGQRAAVERLLTRDGIDEAFVLTTCNRAEAYVVADDPERSRAVLREFVEGVPTAAVRELDHEASLCHLLRVACGLESLVLGEAQILGQLRAAVADARGVGAVGPVLDEGLSKALHVGERARTETAIDEGVVSLGRAAVELAAAERELDDASALVVGAGEMGTVAARALAESVDTQTVANRTIPHADHIAEQVGDDAVETEAVGLDALPEAVADADVVVSATGSREPVIDYRSLAEAGETFVVDIAQPRDCPPAAADISDVTVRDLDALESVTEDTRERRRAAAERVEAMVDREFDRLMARYKRMRADEVIAAMYESAEQVKHRELRTALSKLDTQGEFTDEQRATVEALADSLVGQLLAAPTESLRDAAENDDWATITTALGLFDPEFGDGVAPADPAEPGPASIPEPMREELPAAVRDRLER
jgi:glutamyl-tRNA reductase